MRHRWLIVLLSVILAGPSGLIISAADPPDPGVTLIGKGEIPGDALDLSGLQGLSICQLAGPSCIDRATFGGFGSALAYTGHDNVFLAVPDRGPFDGITDVPYLDRFHLLHIKVDVGGSFPNITTTLLDTRFLTDQGHQNFVGRTTAFSDTNPLETLRFDPEGVTVAADGTFFISDEYGPDVMNFNRQGQLVRRIPVPSKFLLDLFQEASTGHQSGEVDANGNSLELYPAFNTTGRQANRGMEGLTLTPDGTRLVGIMQNALLQDNGVVLDADGFPARVGVNNRILTIDLATGATHEYVYPLEASNRGKGTNEILAINNHEFLVLERDNRTLVPTPPGAANAPELKTIYKIDLNQSGLSDVSNTPILPATKAGLAALLPPVVPLLKTPVVNLLNSNYVVSTNPTKTVKDVIAEKVEGMAWGPDLADGRHVLYVMTDNDLYTGYLPNTVPRPTQIYAFAIDGAAAHVDYEPAQLPEPLFPPGQLKKMLQQQ